MVIDGIENIFGFYMFGIPREGSLAGRGTCLLALPSQMFSLFIQINIIFPVFLDSKS